MIFVTVGTQVQFDRLIRTVDEWAGARARSDIFAQIGPSTINALELGKRINVVRAWANTETITRLQRQSSSPHRAASRSLSTKGN